MTTATDHPFADILNAGRKVVFSRTLRTAEWANTTIAAGDTTEEIDKLRRGGDGHIVVWGGVSFWRSLKRSEEHTSELQSQSNLVCRLLLEKKNRYMSSQH